MIKKAIIPAAGYGTRSLPITKVIPKEMFPVGVKPAIQYVVEEAISSGIESILMIVSRKKNMIVDYFDDSLELEAFLERENKIHLLDKNLIPKIEIHYIRQPYARGLGDAVRLGKTFACDEPVAVLLPDDLIMNTGSPGLKQLIEVYEKYETSVIGLNQVEKHLLKNYGVINGKKVQKGLLELDDLVEKPGQNAPSNYAVIGRYILKPSIFKALETLSVSTEGELQLTDAIKEMLKTERCLGKLVKGKRFDIGSEKDYIDLVNHVHGKKSK